MIGIELEDGFVDLADSAKINLTLVNPLITDDVAVSSGSYSLPFPVAGPAVSGENAQKLKHPDVIRNYQGSNVKNAKLWYDGIRYKTGKLAFKEIGKEANSNFIFGLSQLSDDIKNKKIRDLISENIVISNVSVTKKIYAKLGAAAVVPYSLSVNGKSYQGNTLSLLASAINANTEGVLAQASVVSSGSTPNGLAAPFLEIVPFVGPSDPLSPLSVTSEENGNVATGFLWLLEGFDMTSYWGQFQTYIDQYNTASPINDKVRFPFRFNVNKYGNQAGSILENGVFSQFINGVNASGIYKNFIEYDQLRNVAWYTVNQNSLQPFVMWKYVMDKIAEFLGTSYEGDVYDHPDFQNMLIDNAVSLDEPMDFLGRIKFVFWRRTYNLSELVPDLTISEFLKAYQNRYNFGVSYDERVNKIKLQFRETIAKSYSYDDITGQAGKIEGAGDDRVKGILLRAKREEKDKKNQLANFLVGEEEELVIETSIGGFNGVQHYNGVSGPSVEQPFSETFAFRVFHYLGMQDAGTFDYAKCAPDGTLFAERWEDSPTDPLLKGLYNTFWKRWLLGIKTRKRIKIAWHAYFKDVQSLNFAQKKRVDDVNYMVKQVEFEMSNSKIDIQNVKIELVTV